MYYTSPSVYEFISKQTQDPIVEWKTCRISGAKFPIYQSDLDFYEKISPTFNGQKMKIPTPTLCPEERQRRRLMFRNERKLYRRTCDASGKSIISIYSPDKPYKVYDQKIRRSDARDPMSYGREYDFGRSFTEQFGGLMREVPNLPLFATKNENSEYVNWAEQNKNCYLLFVSDYNEDSYYSDTISYSKNTIDSLSCYNMNNCSDCIGCEWCFNSTKLVDCKNIENSSSCCKCNNLKNCLLCVNLQNKEFCVLNKQYWKDEFEEILRNFDKNSNEYYYKYNELKRILISNNNLINSEMSYWNNLYNCNHNIWLFEWFDSEYCKYWINCNKIKDCYDAYVIVDNSSLCYESVSTISTFKSSFTYCCRHENQNLYYCSFCSNCQNCFGCIWLRNKSYCIFNKQYTKEEYEILVPKIIAHMQKTVERWEFFDPSLSPFSYNETVAQEYFPLTNEELLAREYKRQDKNYDPVIPEWADVLCGDQVPADISTVTDDILHKIIKCEVSGRPFRIIKQELDFYRKHNLPLPRKHPDVRHEERLRQRPPCELHFRNCDKCRIEMVSVYAKKDENLENDENVGQNNILLWNEQKVYCEKCYQQEIYG